MEVKKQHFARLLIFPRWFGVGWGMRLVIKQFAHQLYLMKIKIKEKRAVISRVERETGPSRYD